MTNNPDFPRPDDAVLGGQSSPPLTAAVLGGLEGVKQRLASQVVEQRVSALQDALKYGEKGLDLAIQALMDSSQELQLAAFALLQDRTEPKVKQALEEHIPLISAVGMDYKPLQALLAARQWNSADEETRTLLLQVAKRETLWLREADIKKLPCVDLLTIDRLWTHYSEGRFGFSVQKNIWLDSLKTGTKAHDVFCDRVGWRQKDNSDGRKNLRFGIKMFTIVRCDEIPFDLNAPVGHLPSVCELGGGIQKSMPYTNDTESTMGFYSIDDYVNRWTWDSFFGAEMVKCFLDRFQNCQK